MKLIWLVKAGDLGELREILRSILIWTDYFAKMKEDMAIKKIGKIQRKIETIEDIECGKILQFGKI